MPMSKRRNGTTRCHHSRTFKNCHPERSNSVREANEVAESKDPCNADTVCAAAGSSHDDVSGGERSTVTLISATTQPARRVVRTPFCAARGANGYGVLRLLRAIRFANRPAALRMTMRLIRSQKRSELLVHDALAAEQNSGQSAA
jgi:hypothetical protein